MQSERVLKVEYEDINLDQQEVSTHVSYHFLLNVVGAFIQSQKKIISNESRIQQMWTKCFSKMNTSIHLSLFILSRFSAVETCTLRKKIEENNYKNVMGTQNICTYMEKLCGKKNSLYTLFSQISQCSHNEHCNTLQQHVQVGSKIIFSCFYHKVRP